MHLVESGLLAEFFRLLKLLLRFARESNDYIRRDCRIREYASEYRHALGILGRGVFPVHSGESFIAAAL